METKTQVLNNTELNQVEQAVAAAVEEVAREFWQLRERQERVGAKWLTRQIKEAVGALGEERGMCVCSSEHGKRGQGNHEWLYDLVWYKSDASEKLLEVPFVLESELSDRSRPGLWWDFEKLLLANAEHRVFVCFNDGNYHFPDNINRLIQDFDNSVAAYKGLAVGARVLVLIWDDYSSGEVYPHVIVK